MTQFYTIIDEEEAEQSQGNEYLGSFITSLSPKRIQELEYATNKLWSADKRKTSAKTKIFYDLIMAEDMDFCEIHPRVVHM